MVENSDIGEVVMDDIHMPLLAFKLKDEANLGFSVYDISDRLRKYGWQVPAYTLAEGCEDTSILRIVAKEGFSYDLATLLVKHMQEVIQELKDESKKRVLNQNFTKIC
jgi:glutamate decarboxylase